MDVMDQESLQKILSPEVQGFIRENENADEKALVLKHKAIFALPSSTLAEQISGRRKAKDKIPTFYSSEIVYPPGINMEQCSSEQTAVFKAKIFLEALPLRKSLIDLTGGFGVDSYFLSKVFKAVHYVEPNSVLFEIVKRNHDHLQGLNITHYNTSAEKFLAEDQESSAVFIDPSRRNEFKKVFAFADCEPNVVSLKDEIFKTSDFALIKASPLLDLKLAIHELSFVKKVVVLSVDNEVKELLFLCKKGFAEEPIIEAVNLRRGSAETFSFKFSEEVDSSPELSDPKSYLYEPNASILKAGAFKSIATDFNLTKIQTNTHLYTSDAHVQEFPGRIFKIISEVKPDKKLLLPFFPEGKANVTTRNYPLSVEELKKKTGLNDGGEKYLIAFSGQTKKFVVAAERVR
jgi:hypothetical protein